MSMPGNLQRVMSESIRWRWRAGIVSVIVQWEDTPAVSRFD